ncbi:MAG: preprotein translocase subunit YajC [Candidatus Lambdaproteobacteria bacterium]|nr:preprotein translocase subunit YajC [Candidatus Lambdaproteobacteria bacterium]
MFPFVTEALAMPPSGGTGGGGAGSLIQSLIPFALIFAIFWFLVIRPQQKKSKAHREMLGSLKKGDEVITDSGLYGTIQKLAEDAVSLEIAPKVTVRVARTRIAELAHPPKAVEPKASEAKSKAQDKQQDEEKPKDQEKH